MKKLKEQTGEQPEKRIPTPTPNLEKKTEPVGINQLNTAYDQEYGWIPDGNVSALLKSVLRELVWARLWREKHG